MVALSGIRGGVRWQLAPALVRLMQDVDAKWPNRVRISDGSIGDTAHSRRTSDHNPFLGIVHAVDITSAGIDKQGLIQAAQNDSRTKYIISDGRIWQNGRYYKSGGWYKYTGSNPHNHHTHISVTPDGALNPAAWFNSSAAPTPAPVPREWDEMATKEEIAEVV